VLSNHLSLVSPYAILKSYGVAVGQSVKADDIIARIETDKVTVDILAKYSGVITKYHAVEGETVAVGANFVDIDPSGTASAAAPAQPKQEAASTPTPKVRERYLIL